MEKKNREKTHTHTPIRGLIAILTRARLDFGCFDRVCRELSDRFLRRELRWKTNPNSTGSDSASTTDLPKAFFFYFKFSLIRTEKESVETESK